MAKYWLYTTSAAGTFIHDKNDNKQNMLYYFKNDLECFKLDNVPQNEVPFAVSLHDHAHGNHEYYKVVNYKMKKVSKEEYGELLV